MIEILKPIDIEVCDRIACAVNAQLGPNAEVNSEMVRRIYDGSGRTESHHTHQTIIGILIAEKYLRLAPIVNDGTRGGPAPL